MTNETIRDETLDAVTAVVRSILPMDEDAMWDATATAAARELNAAGLVARPSGGETTDVLAMLVEYARSCRIPIPVGFAPVTYSRYPGVVRLSQDEPAASVMIPNVEPVTLARFAMTWRRS